jgi:7-cyano-7-deazaguanine reductase
VIIMARPPVTQLGQQTPMPDSPEAALLERVANPHPDTLYVARFTQPEFTSLCPVTAQPDFAHLVIDYVPNQWLVESKSLKLYLASFRNHGAFHEDCTVAIRAAACRSTYSGSTARFLPASGCPSRACSLIVAAADDTYGAHNVFATNAAT